MCGIIGIASTRPVTSVSSLAVARDTMIHRGPDGAGEWWSVDRRVGLAHRRLAIIDLSQAAAQPMRDSSGELCVVFNGEIYNFKELRSELAAKSYSFRSDSDTEVILAAYREWGTDCLSRLNGMFAFALHDASRHRLFIARDRAGEKPLFYRLADGEFGFASELKGLLATSAWPRRIDAEAMDCYLTAGFVPGARCLLQGVKKLRPAHALTFDLADANIRSWRYWHLPTLESDTNAQPNESDLLDELEALLEDSVRRQLVADVPVGVLLSGGVDSSLVTAMAVRAMPNVKTFSVRFPGYGGYDETAHAHLVARHFHTDHVDLDATDVSVGQLTFLARQFDEPIADSSLIPTYAVSRLIRQHCAVALGGDGGDELFGGYTHYSRLLATGRAVRYIPRVVRHSVAEAAMACLPVGFRGRNWLQGFDFDFATELPGQSSFFDRRSRHRLLNARRFPLPSVDRVCDDSPSSELDLVQRATRTDFQNYLADDILVKVDRASMLNSLEVRAPFLDHRLIAFAFRTVPSRLKATTTNRKVILKRLTARLLPPEFDQQRKQGFSIPLGQWLRSGPWKTFFEDVLLGSTDTLFDRNEAKRLMDGQAMGRANTGRLFALVMLELWRREYSVSW